MAREANEIKRQKEERKRMKEECEQRKEERKKAEKKEMQQHNRVNKSFEKIPRFDGSAPHYCFDWLEQTEALSNRYPDRNYKEELLFNCSDSVSKTIHAVPEGATNQQIEDAVLCNHSNLCTLSQQSNAYQNMYQKPDEALQTYNTRYSSYFRLAYPELDLDNPLTRMHCIHYTSSLHGKLSDEMTGKFNQDLPENLHAAFEKTANFEPHIITKQSIHERKVHKVNQIDVSPLQNEVEINEAHVRNPNYKGKNYGPNYQQNRNKQYPTTNISGPNYKNGDNQHNTYNKPSSQGNNYNSQGNNYQKNTLQDKLANVSVTLNGPVTKEQLYKIQEVLRHPSQYRDRIRPEDRPATGEYAKTFNKF